MINILLSTYNGEQFLAQQLDSIINQSYSDWQLYIRDDGSTDGTISILNEYSKKDNRIHLFEDINNLGACRSFERLLTLFGDADYFAFSDQDDVWNVDKLAVLLETMQSATKEDQDQPIVVHSDLSVVDEHLYEISPSFWRYSNIHPEILDNNIRYLSICNSVTGCTMLFNRKAREYALPMSEKAYMHDAWIALSTLNNGGKIIPIFKSTIAYRQHGENALGAIKYSLLGRSISNRLEDAKRCYKMAHPQIYKNMWSFLMWKIIYICHRTFYNISQCVL